ncbi:MAG TPA: cytochrome c [Hyphomicrobiales bacterium]|nr:cytochrome c [Hyphomicrobiales bacterium]
MSVMRRFTIGVGFVVALSGLSGASGADDSLENLDRPLTVEEARSLKNLILPAGDSIAKGRTSYLQYACGTCHGEDGRALTVFAGPVTDLTNPEVWINGTSEGEVFRSIRDGVSGMPSFAREIDNEKIWHLVNFIRSLWPSDALAAENQ